MSEEDKKWSQLPLTELRFVAKKYKQFHSLGNISKAKKEDLITTLKKFMMFEGNAIKQKPNATPIATTGTMEAPAPKAKKPKAPAPPPAPAVMGDKGYKKMVKKVKDPKKQMEGASADAKAIAEQAPTAPKRIIRANPRKPKKIRQMEGAVMDAKKIAEDAKAMGHSVAEHKKMLEKEATAPPKKPYKGYYYTEGMTKAEKVIAKAEAMSRRTYKEDKQPKPKAPTPPPKELTEKQKKEKAKRDEELEKFKNMTAEEEEAERIAYFKKKADQKAKDDAKKAKASKPASMPMMTDSGASASSAPASDFLPDPYDTELKKGGDVPERLYEWYIKNILTNPRKNDVLDMTSENYDKLWNGYISISTLGGYKSTAKRKSKMAKEVESESDAFRQLEKSEEKKWVEEAKKLPFFPYLSAYTLRRVMDDTDGQQTLKLQIDKLKKLKDAYGLLISQSIWTKLNTLFSKKN
jgi:hypothetical protein